MTETVEHEQETERASVDETITAIEEAQEKAQRETRGPHHKRKNTSDPDASEEDQIIGEQQNAQLNAASALLSQARDAVTAHNVADERLKSDPRYERDQKIFMMGQRGTLGQVPPFGEGPDKDRELTRIKEDGEIELKIVTQRDWRNKETRAQLKAEGWEPTEEIEDVEEQVEEDMERLNQVDEQGQIRPGVQESDQSTMNADAGEQGADETQSSGTPIK